LKGLNGTWLEVAKQTKLHSQNEKGEDLHHQSTGFRTGVPMQRGRGTNQLSKNWMM
jgi:hypothetical protein